MTDPRTRPASVTTVPCKDGNSWFYQGYTELIESFDTRPQGGTIEEATKFARGEK
jgi:hypothetical protein